MAAYPVCGGLVVTGYRASEPTDLEISQSLVQVAHDVLRTVVGIPQLGLDKKLLPSYDAFGDALRDCRASTVALLAVPRVFYRRSNRLFDLMIYFLCQKQKVSEHRCCE